MNVHFIRRRADGTIIEAGNCDESIFQLMQERTPNEYSEDDGTAQLTPPPPPPPPADAALAATAAPDDLAMRLERIEERLDALEK